MPSLLDIMIQNRRGPQGGLLGQNTAPPEASPLAALTGASQGQAASGGGSPTPMPPVSLSPEEQERIRSQQLLGTGLGILTADPSSGDFSRIAQGIIAGQTLGQQAREQAIEAGQRARDVAIQAEIGQLFGGDAENVTRQDAERALQLALSSGKLETAKTLQDFIDSMPEEEKQFKPETVQLADGTTAVFDPNERAFYNASGEVLTELPEDVATEDDELKFVEGADPVTGDPISGVINLNEGTFTEIPGIVSGEDMNTKEFNPETIEAAKEATIARANLNTIQDYLETRIQENPKNPLRGIRFDRARFEETGLLVPLAQRQNLDTETQQFLQAQEAFMLQLAHQLAGVRGVSAENAREAIFRTFGFEEGDSPENIQNTLRELEIKTRALELRAGNALSLFKDFDIDRDSDESNNMFEGI